MIKRRNQLAKANQSEDLIETFFLISEINELNELTFSVCIEVIFSLCQINVFNLLHSCLY